MSKPLKSGHGRPPRPPLGDLAVGAGALRCPLLARQARMRLVGRRVGGVPSLVSARCAIAASDSPTIVWLRARHRGQCVIANQEALGATVSPQRGHRRTDSSPRAPDADGPSRPHHASQRHSDRPRAGLPMGSGPPSFRLSRRAAAREAREGRPLEESRRGRIPRPSRLKVATSHLMSADLEASKRAWPGRAWARRLQEIGRGR